MRKEHQLRLLFRDEILQRVDVGVGGVVIERRRFQCIDMGAGFGGQVGGGSAETAAGKDDFNRPSRLLGNGLGGGDGFKRDAVEFAFALLGDYEDGVWHGDSV